jgi:hypothetical protein
MTTGIDNSAEQAASSPHVTFVEQVRSENAMENIEAKKGSKYHA